MTLQKETQSLRAVLGIHLAWIVRRRALRILSSKHVSELYVRRGSLSITYFAARKRARSQVAVAELGAGGGTLQRVVSRQAMGLVGAMREVVRRRERWLPWRA